MEGIWFMRSLMIHIKIFPFTKSILFEEKHKSQQLEILEDHKIRRNH